MFFTSENNNHMVEVKNCGHEKRPLKLSIENKEVLIRGFSGSDHRAQMKHKFPIDGVNVLLAGMIYDDIGRMFSNSRLLLPAREPNVPSVVYEIIDRGTPSSNGEFELLVSMLLSKLKKGENVNISCIGGHGRTGLLMAILYGALTGSKTPIEDVRTQYCEEAVESYEQKCFVHSFLKLPAPVQDVRWCVKCHKEPQQPNDSYCVACNAVWKAEQAERMAKAVPLTGYTNNTRGYVLGKQTSSTKFYCSSCFLRRTAPSSSLCPQCLITLGNDDNEGSYLKKTYPKKLRKKLGCKSNIETAKLIYRLDNTNLHTMSEEDFKLYSVVNEWDRGLL